MYRLKSRCLIVLFALATLGCAKPQPMKITKTLDLPESDKAPVISTILDYGNYELPTDGSLEQITGDGKFVPGELLIIRGKNFGRLPTVTIAEKATPILARLGDGAIVTRMPHGIEAGTQNVAVSTEKGLHQKPVKVVRYALAQAPGSKDVVLFDAWNFTKIKSYSVGNVLGIAFSESSSYAYLVTGEKSGFVLLTMDLTAAPAPRFVDKKPFKGSTLLGFGYSASRKVFVAATNLGIKGFSVDSPGSPIPSPVQAWSKDIAAKDIIEAALSPDGKNVAIILTTDNTLALFDIQVLHNIKKGPRLKLMPDAKVPLLKSLKFHNEKVGSSLYVLTGDTPASLKVGYHDNKVIVLEVISARDRTLDAKVKIEETRPMMFQKVTPSALTFASRGVSKMEDTAITKWTRYFYFSTFHAELLTLAKLPLSTPSGIQTGIDLINGLPYLSVLHRLDQKSTPRTFRKAKKVTGSLAISTDGRQALAVNCTPITDKTKLTISIPCEIEVLTLESGRSQTFAMGKLTGASFVPPFRFGATAIQD